MGVLYLRACLSKRAALEVYERREDNMTESWRGGRRDTRRDTILCDLDLTARVTWM
jgi:hypothetical protein